MLWVLPRRDVPVYFVTRVAYTGRPDLCLCDEVFVSVSEVNQTSAEVKQEWTLTGNVCQRMDARFETFVTELC